MRSREATNIALSKTLSESVGTPALIYDEPKILRAVLEVKGFCQEIGCKVFFPLKSFSIVDALRFLALHLDGFSASSLFEAKLGKGVLKDTKPILITTPNLKPGDIPSISHLCAYISFNSISQYTRYQNELGSGTSCGLRVNPQLSFLLDDRYNPCRKSSKLGVPLNTLRQFSNNALTTLNGVKGLHFHTNCESTDFSPLLKTVKHIDVFLHRLLRQIDWVNLGGGYLFDNSKNLHKLGDAVALLRNKYDVEVLFEPGKAVVGNAGYIVSSVVDLFESDGNKIAILDTTVNHMPEVFEYQYKPDIAQESEGGEYVYILAGATCLAGDLFGEYRFDEPLEIGSRILFEDMGAYTLVKANMFNGVNLPSIYAYTSDRKLELKKQFGYEDFLSRCGGNNNDPI